MNNPERLKKEDWLVETIDNHFGIYIKSYDFYPKRINDIAKDIRKKLLEMLPKKKPSWLEPRKDIKETWWNKGYSDGYNQAIKEIKERIGDEN